MAKSAIIKSPGDQAIRDKEKAALKELFIDLIENHDVTKFVISCFDDANVHSLPILKSLKKKYPHIDISKYSFNDKEYRQMRESADVVIITMGCSICHRSDNCLIRDELMNFIADREVAYMSDYFSGTTPATIGCLPATLLNFYNMHQRGGM